jgi:hypothetical protein
MSVKTKFNSLTLNRLAIDITPTSGAKIEFKYGAVVIGLLCN